MRFSLLFVFLASIGFSGSESLESFTCSVAGYTPKTFELKRVGSEFQIQASHIYRNYRWYLEAEDCALENRNSLPGLFSCESSRPGILELEGTALQYEKMRIQVSYEKRFIKVTQHRRIIDIEFEGGDFETPLTLQMVVTVNFYNLNPGITDAFNETCSMNGQLIKQ